jgi:hypothetical protein
MRHRIGRSGLNHRGVANNLAPSAPNAPHVSLTRILDAR